MIKEFYENLKISIIIHVDDLVSLVLWLKDVSRVKPCRGQQKNIYKIVMCTKIMHRVRGKKILKERKYIFR